MSPTKLFTCCSSNSLRYSEKKGGSQYQAFHLGKEVEMEVIDGGGGVETGGEGDGEDKEVLVVEWVAGGRRLAGKLRRLPEVGRREAGLRG